MYPEMLKTKNAISPKIPREVVIVLLITLCGLLLRLYDLGSKSFWTDELLSIWHAKDITSVKAFFSPLHGNAHPPLYFLFLKLWSLGGEGESYLRLLAVIFGVLVIPATYFLGKQFFSQKTSLVGAFLVAISPLHMLYDREVRMYSLFTLLTIISLYFFIRALREGKTKLWIGYTAFTILTTYTHYHAFLVILFEWIFFIVRFKYYKYWIKKAVLSQLIIAVSFAFLLPAFLYHLKHYSVLGEESTRFPITLGSWTKPFYLFFSFSIGQTVLPWNYIIVIPSFVIFSIVLVSGIKGILRQSEVLQFFLMSLIIPIFAGLFISDTMPRYFLFLAPVYSLMIAKGISTLPLVKIRAVLLVAIAVLLSFSLKNYYTNKEFHILCHVDPWHQVGQYIKENVNKDDIVFNVGGVPLNYYSELDIPVLENDVVDVIRECLSNRPAQSGRVCLVVSNPLFKQQGLEAVKWMSENYQLMSEQRFLRDADYRMKEKIFNKNFMEYRISVLFYN